MENYNFSGQMNVPPNYPMYPNYGGSYRPASGTFVNTNKIFVDGINDVYNKHLPGGSDYIFVDRNEDVLYQKIVDNSGKPEVKVYDIVPRNSQQQNEYVSRQEFEELKSSIKNLEDYLPKISNQGGVDNGTK